MQVVIFLFIFVFSLYAETLEEIAHKAYIANINTLLIFTSSEGLNSGHYHFSKIGVDMDVSHLPFTYHFTSSEGFNYFIMGNVGYSRVALTQTNVALQGIELNYDNHLQTYTAGLGGGVRYKVDDALYVMGGIELIFSRSGASVKQPENDYGDIIEDFFNNHYNDNLSYEYLIKGGYEPQNYSYKPYITLGYKIYDTKSTMNLDEMLTLSSHSSVATLSLGVETPSLYTFGKRYVTFEGYYHLNYLDGLVEDVTKFYWYSSVGGVCYLYTPQKPFFASRFFLELSSVRSYGLEGYNVGVGFTLKL